MASAEILGFLQTRNAAGRRVVAYGGSTRSATLLNCCGLTEADIACVADPDPARQGRLMPGSRISIVSPEALMAAAPDDVVILAWPNAVEIAPQLQPLRQQGAQLWTLVPRISRV
jgi:ABC-type Fe3+-hydroxamate transport system substrate-binding protein